MSQTYCVQYVIQSFDSEMVGADSAEAAMAEVTRILTAEAVGGELRFEVLSAEAVEEEGDAPTDATV